MCGITGLFGPGWYTTQLRAAIASQRHRGPDAEGWYIDASGAAALGHNRLSILDLSPAGKQPMSTPDGRVWVVLNGEIYNYEELREELRNYPYSSRTDTEVILAAYERWGVDCLQRFIGMFAFLLWDEREQRLFAARDRFGVKPLYYHRAADGTLLVTSEIKALHAAGVPAVPDTMSWASYLAHGTSDTSERTFWDGILTLPAGHYLLWQDNHLKIDRWYDLAEQVGDAWDTRPVDDVQEEYLSLLLNSVRLRFRSDVPVGINLSGGLDSSTLLGLVQAVQGADSDVKAFTFATGDPAYDELPWVEQMLARTRHPSVVCRLTPDNVPALAASVQASEDEPFGGLPTLAYARLFEVARSQGVVVLLDGQGMDEQWAGYDYYAAALGDEADSPLVQGTKESPVRPHCLSPDFRRLAVRAHFPRPFADSLRNLQYRDACYTKIPRALRFNDRASMRAARELREPFLDHRLFVLAMRQPPERKIHAGSQKWMLRRIAAHLLPQGVVEAPKRPLQTPQREWLRGPLREWADSCIEQALDAFGGTWLEADEVRSVWADFRRGASDNSFYVWQWIGLGLLAPRMAGTHAAALSA